MPPEHTLIIEENITISISNTARQQIDRYLRHHIITSSGDANVMMGSKHIDPALCIYIGAYLMGPRGDSHSQYYIDAPAELLTVRYG